MINRLLTKFFSSSAPFCGISLGQSKNRLLEKVNKKSGANVLECYQCGKCVGSCPVAPNMSVSPRQMMQLIKLGQENEVFRADTSWYCLSCSTCSARCPREIDIPGVMEAIRHLAIHEKVDCENPDVNSIRKFHEIFLYMVRIYGRLYELRFMAEFNIRTLDFFKDIFLAPKVLSRGKLEFFTSRVKNIEAIDRLFVASEKLDEKNSGEALQ